MLKQQKIIFFGTTDFSLFVLKKMIDFGITPVAIVTKPDEKKGRGQILSPPPVKEWVAKACPEIPLLQPEKASNPESIDWIASFKPDFFVVVAFGEILSRELLALPRVAPLNIHASLLPKYRGASPIRRAILEDEKETGITLIRMSPELDGGGMLSVARVAILDEDDFGSIEKKLMEASFEPLIEALEKSLKGEKGEIQDLSLVTKAAKFSKEEEKIDWSKPSRKIFCQIRALSPSPGAYTFFQKEGSAPLRIKIFKASIDKKKSLSLPQLVEDKKLWRQASDGALSLEVLQIEGKRVVSAKEFIDGLRAPFEIL